MQSAVRCACWSCTRAIALYRLSRQSSRRWGRGRSPGSLSERSLIAAFVPIDNGPSAVARASAGFETDAVRASVVARGESLGASADSSAAIEASSTVSYIGYPSGPASPGETITIPVALRNRDVVSWPAAGQEAVKLSYHLYDSAGRVVAWDGLRSALTEDLPSGGADVISMTLAAPALTGIYTVKPDLVRDGRGWFSSGGAAPGSFALKVTTDLDAGYGTTTTPRRSCPVASSPSKCT